MAINIPLSIQNYDAGVEIDGERVYIKPGTLTISGVNGEMESTVTTVSAGGGDTMQVYGYDITTKMAEMSFEMANDGIANAFLQKINVNQQNNGYLSVKVFFPNSRGGYFGAMILTSKPERAFSADASITLTFQGNLYSL